MPYRTAVRPLPIVAADPNESGIVTIDFGNGVDIRANANDLVGHEIPWQLEMLAELRNACHERGINTYGQLLRASAANKTAIGSVTKTVRELG